MKKIKLLGLALLAIACNNVKKDTYKVTVNIDGLEDGKKVFLQKPAALGRAEIIDTLEIKEGSFTFTGESAAPELHYLIFEDVRGGLPVVLEEGNIQITAYKDSLGYSILKGSPSNEDFYRFVSGTRGIAKKIMSLRTEMVEATQNNDTVTAGTLQEAFMEVQEEGKKYETDFVKANPSSYISALLFEQMVQQGAKTPEELTALYESLDENVKNYQRVVEAKKSLDELAKLSIGAIAPDFSAPTAEGGKLSLNDAKGKVTLIDFWAAWCKPCRIENPNLVALYKKYHDQGFNILGVSLDRKEEDWKKAIADDGLEWQQVSNLQFWQDPIAQLYNIRAIPASFLLDSQGKIVAKDLRGDELEAKVTELISQM